MGRAISGERSPEVLCIRNAMDETGVHWAMDIHGDEAIPAAFMAGFEGIPSWTDASGWRYYRAFVDRLAARTPDFQTKLGYGISGPGKANLSDVDQPACRTLWSFAWLRLNDARDAI